MVAKIIAYIILGVFAAGCVAFAVLGVLVFASAMKAAKREVEEIREREK